MAAETRVWLGSLALCAALTAPGRAHAQSDINHSATTTVSDVRENRGAPAGTDLSRGIVTAPAGAVAQSAVNVFPSAARLGGNSHACVGTSDILPFGGTAEASSLTTMFEAIRIASSTLPVGSLVSVRLFYTFTLSEHHVLGKGLTNTGTYVNVSADARLTAGYTRLGTSQVVEGRGTFDYAEDFFGPRSGNGRTGLFDSSGGIGSTDGLMTNVAVGDTIQFSSQLLLTTQAVSSSDNYSAADLTVGMGWGVQVLGEAYPILESSGARVPSPSELTPDSVINAIPAFQLPTGFGSSAPEPGSLALLTLGVFGLLARLGQGLRRPREGYC